jgi:hypothetical protein
MKRRDFIKVVGIGSSVIMVPSLLNGNDEKFFQDEYCDNDVLNSWNGHKIDEKDIRLKVLSYAILASNPHNTQAWLIEFIDTYSFYLYVDETRVLPQTDPYYRQIHIGQGTFLENLKIASTFFAYETKVKYFPKGIYDNKTLDKKPVALVQLTENKSIVQDALFKHILTRHTNKREYEDKLIEQHLIKKINNAMILCLGDDMQLHITNDLMQIDNLKKIAIKAMEIESLSKERDLETINMFRFNDDEIEKYRDGFGLAQNGTSTFMRFIIENFFISREDALKNPKSFGKSGTDLVKKQANSANTFGWLTTKNNNRIDQVKIGECYQRLNLIITSLGMVMQPMSQVIQEYEDMKELQKEFLEFLNVSRGETVQMFFRIGIAKETEHSPRREIKDFLV